MANTYGEVPVEELRHYCDPDLFTFESTEQITPLEGTVGQDRGVNAINFGLDIKTQGFNLYIAGPTGTGRNSTVQAFVAAQAEQEQVPHDLCYVNNFKDADSPKAVILPPGMGCGFVKDMDALIDSARQEIPRAFESENYEKRRNDILNELQQDRTKTFADLQQTAAEMGLAIEMTQVGIVTVPVMHGKPLSREDYEKLPQREKDTIDQNSAQLQDRVQQVLTRARKMEKDANERISQLDREIALFAVGHLLDELADKYKDHSDVLDFLSQVRDSMMDSLDDFKERQKPRVEIPGLEGLMPEPSFDRYRVNLIVDNEDQQGAPVICETNPTYYNLIGRVDFKARLGALTTDFTQIKAGAMHKANGGYLILQVMDLLTNPVSWDALKRTLRSGEVRLENIAEHYGLIPTSTLKPEAIPINVKVVLIGNPMIYHLLYAYDEDFRKLFKVKADFDIEMTRDDDHVQKYASFIAARIKKVGLKPFHKSGVAKVVEYGSRLIEDKGKLSARFIDVADIVSEASYWAQRDGNEYVMAEDVQKAIDEKKFRSNLIEQKIQEHIEEGMLMIDTAGEKIGQANGLSVYSIGNYMFGRPSRLTCRTFIGKGGLVNVEREVKMSGPIHDKGAMIVTAYLAGRYAQDKPLPVGASITFEQLYDGVEGDSASSTELYALLSSLSDLPIKQGIAVTGSVNQNGEIQPIGGVNYKIEGFYEVCKAKGLDGTQGVMIPHQNVRNLMLTDEVVQAIKNGSFHIWPVKWIDEGIEILTGVPAGQKDASGNYPADTVHGRASKKIDQFAEKLREYAAPELQEKREEDEDLRIAA